MQFQQYLRFQQSLNFQGLILSAIMAFITISAASAASAATAATAAAVAVDDNTDIIWTDQTALMAVNTIWDRLYDQIPQQFAPDDNEKKRIISQFTKQLTTGNSRFYQVKLELEDYFTGLTTDWKVSSELIPAADTPQQVSQPVEVDSQRSTAPKPETDRKNKLNLILKEIDLMGLRPPSYPIPVNQNNVSFKSPGFHNWIEEGLSQKFNSETPDGRVWNHGQKLDWSGFPNIRNDYGQPVGIKRFIYALIYIESSGVHSRQGQVADTMNFHGFLQLSQSWPARVRNDGKLNVMAGIHHVYSGFIKVFEEELEKRRYEPLLDRLLMVAVAYNRGRFSPAMKHTWKKLVEITEPVSFSRRKYYGMKDSRMGVLYGLKCKAGMGFKFDPPEEEWLRKMQRGNPDIFAKRFYVMVNCLINSIGSPTKPKN